MTQAASVSLLHPHFQARLERLLLTTRTRQRGYARGQHTARRSGVGIEFAEHRPYSPGDDLRFVDFHAFARSDRLLIKQFSEAQDVSVCLLLDCSRSMALETGHKLRYAKQLTAAIGYVTLAGLDRLSIQAFDAALGARLEPMRGRSRALHMLRFLEQLTAQGTTHFATVARRFVARETQRGLVVLITDGYDQSLLRGIDLLRYARFEPVVLVLRDPDDENVAMGSHLLRDAETGATRAIDIDASTLATVRRSHQAHFAALMSGLRERRVSGFELRLDQPFDTALVMLQRQGGLFR